MTSITKITIGLAAVAAFLTTPAFAQSEQNVRVSFGVGVAAGAISGEPIFGGSVGYKFSKHFSFDVEVAGSGEPANRFGGRMFDLGDTMGGGAGRLGDLIGRAGGGASSFLPGGIGAFRPNLLSVENGGSTLLSTAGIRYLIPAIGERVQPYVSGGLGVARTEQSIRFDTGSLPVIPGLPVMPGRPGIPGLPGMTVPSLDLDRSTSHVGIVLGAGVGASIRLVKALSLDIDARYYRLDRGRNLGSFGGGVSYRF